MYDLSAFDSKYLKVLTAIYKHAKLILLLSIVSLCVGVVFKPFFFVGVTLIIVSLYNFFTGNMRVPGEVFAHQNNLSRPFISQSANYLFLYEEYKSMKQSALFKDEAFVWGLPAGGIDYGLMFLKNTDVVAWARLNQDFPQIVIDATSNKRYFGNNIQKEKLPIQKIELEGNFPDYFKVYAGKDEQMLALQILSPDRMAVLVDKLGLFDFEIKGNHLKIYVVGAQKSAASMQSFIDVLETLSKDLKVEKINKIKQ